VAHPATNSDLLTCWASSASIASSRQSCSAADLSGEATSMLQADKSASITRWPRRASSASAVDLPVPDMPVIRTRVISSKLSRPLQTELMRSRSRASGGSQQARCLFRSGWCSGAVKTRRPPAPPSHRGCSASPACTGWISSIRQISRGRRAGTPAAAELAGLAPALTYLWAAPPIESTQPRHRIPHQRRQTASALRVAELLTAAATRFDH
jgi:hypothetical protein